MDLMECHIFEKDIYLKTSFTTSQPQGYYRLIDNPQRVGYLNYIYKLEMNRGPRQTAQIAEPPLGSKASLKFVMIRCAGEEKIAD